MSDEMIFRLRRDMLEQLYRLYLESPSAQGVWHANRSDPECMPRKREAEYLRAKGYVEGSIGVDGGLALRLTPVTGREYVESGGFWTEKPSEKVSGSSPTVTDDDINYMRMAIDEAKKSKAEDNDRVHPMVGAVAVKDGKLLGVAHRGELGPGEHGEYTLLERKLSKETLTGATVYVTLEPCTARNHPKVCCAERLLERKVARVVIGMVDPDDRISGRGMQMLRTGRVAIDHFTEELAAQVEELNRDFMRSKKMAAASKPSHTEASKNPARTADVHIAIHNSTVHGDVVGGDKKS